MKSAGLCFVHLICMNILIHLGRAIGTTNYGNKDQKAILTLLKHLPEIFPSFQTNVECTNVYINPENRYFQLCPVRNTQDTVNLIISSSKVLRSTNLKLKHSRICSFVTYSSFQNSVQDYKEDLVSLLPGDTAFSFNFLFENNLPPATFWHLPFVRRLSNILVFVPKYRSHSEKDHNFKWTILTSNRYGSVRKYMEIGELGDSLCLNSKVGKYNGRTELFWNKWKDMEGAEFRIGVPPPVSQQTFRLYREKGQYRFLPVLITEVSNMLNSSLQIVETDATVGNGERLQNGTWTSYIGQLMSGATDISVPFVPFAFQYKVLGMSKGLMISPIKFFTPLPEKMKFSFKFLTAPFDKTIWLAIFICIIANVAVIYFLKKYTNQLPESTTNRIYFVIAKMTDFFRVLIDQSIPVRVLAFSKLGSNGTRIIFIMWLAIMIVLGNLYKSFMISMLVEPDYEKPPLTIMELIQSDFHVNFPLYKAFHFDTRLSWVKDLKHPVTDFEINVSGCLESLLDGPNVCMFVSNYLHIFASEYLVDASGRLQFLESKDSIYATTSFFGISRLNPQLKEAIDKLVDVIVEGALDLFWMKLKFHQSSLKTIRRKKSITMTALEYNLVNEDLMLCLLLILIAGLIIGMFCFVAERIWIRSSRYAE